MTAEPRLVEALLIPFHDHGTPIGTVWVVSHRVERKFDREDERIVRLLSQFASAGWQLWKTTETVQAMSHRRDHFLATLGHELRNPFGAIMTATAVLQERIPPDEHASRAVAVIARQTHHVSRLLDDLLDLTRIDSGKLKVERRTIDLRAVVADTIETRRPQIDARGHVLTLTLGAEPIWVDADPVRLAQVVSNVVDNAAKYTPQHGRIFVTLSSAGSEVVLTVRDTGVGIPTERLQTIFEPFTQLESPHDTSAGGLGLGLPLVRRLTELHGGSVKAVSAGPGHGSCFTVQLPISQHADPARAGT